jgi:anti-sigma factor RsiW
MTTPHIDDDLLQRYFDGDLPEGEADEVRRTVEASDDARAQLDRLDRLGRLMRLAADDLSLDVGTEDLYARVSQDVKAGDRRAALRPIEGGRGRRMAVATGMGLALAAAVTLALLQPWQASPGTPVAEAPVRDALPALAGGAEQPGRQGSEVLEVDFGGNTGTVFEVQGAAGQPLAVVWINDDGVLQ